MKNQNLNINVIIVGVIILVLTFLIVITFLASSKIEYESSCKINGISLEINKTGFNYFSIDKEGEIDCEVKGKMPLWLLAKIK